MYYYLNQLNILIIIQQFFIDIKMVIHFDSMILINDINHLC